MVLGEVSFEYDCAQRPAMPKYALATSFGRATVAEAREEQLQNDQKSKMRNHNQNIEVEKDPSVLELTLGAQNASLLSGRTDTSAIESESLEDALEFGYRTTEIESEGVINLGSLRVPAFSRGTMEVQGPSLLPMERRRAHMVNGQDVTPEIPWRLVSMKRGNSDGAIIDVLKPSIARGTRAKLWATAVANRPIPQDMEFFYFEVWYQSTDGVAVGVTFPEVEHRPLIHNSNSNEPGTNVTSQAAQPRSGTDSPNQEEFRGSSWSEFGHRHDPYESDEDMFDNDIDYFDRGDYSDESEPRYRPPRLRRHAMNPMNMKIVRVPQLRKWPRGGFWAQRKYSGVAGYDFQRAIFDRRPDQGIDDVIFVPKVALHGATKDPENLFIQETGILWVPSENLTLGTRLSSRKDPEKSSVSSPTTPFEMKDSQYSNCMGVLWDSYAQEFSLIVNGEVTKRSLAPVKGYGNMVPYVAVSGNISARVEFGDGSKPNDGFRFRIQDEIRARRVELLNRGRSEIANELKEVDATRTGDSLPNRVFKGSESILPDDLKECTTAQRLITSAEKESLEFLTKGIGKNFMPLEKELVDMVDGHVANSLLYQGYQLCPEPPVDVSSRVQSLGVSGKTEELFKGAKHIRELFEEKNYSAVAEFLANEREADAELAVSLRLLSIVDSYPETTSTDTVLSVTSRLKAMQTDFGAIKDNPDLLRLANIITVNPRTKDEGVAMFRSCESCANLRKRALNLWWSLPDSPGEPESSSGPPKFEFYTIDDEMNMILKRELTTTYEALAEESNNRETNGAALRIFIRELEEKMR